MFDTVRLSFAYSVGLRMARVRGDAVGAKGPVTGRRSFRGMTGGISAVAVVKGITLSLLGLFTKVITRSGTVVDSTVRSTSSMFDAFMIVVKVELTSGGPSGRRPCKRRHLRYMTTVILTVILLVANLKVKVRTFGAVLRKGSSGVRAPNVLTLVTTVVSVVDGRTVC